MTIERPYVVGARPDRHYAGRADHNPQWLQIVQGSLRVQGGRGGVIVDPIREALLAPGTAGPEVRYRGPG
jgi:hypothetical protein